MCCNLAVLGYVKNQRYSFISLFSSLHKFFLVFLLHEFAKTQSPKVLFDRAINPSSQQNQQTNQSEPSLDFKRSHKVANADMIG